jgi:hypothetical protein
VSILGQPGINQLNTDTGEPITQAFPGPSEIFQLSRKEVLHSRVSFAVVTAVFMSHADDLADRVMGHEESDPRLVCVKTFGENLQTRYATGNQEAVAGSGTEVFLAKIF